MIDFESEKNKVTVRVDLGVGKYRYWNFSTHVGHDEKSDALATIMVMHLNERLNGLVENAKTEAYNQGWKDKTKKRKKAKYFSPQLEFNEDRGGCYL